MRSDMVWRLLADWVPMLLLVAAFVFFMRRLYRPDSPYNRAFAEQKRHNEALEKILANIDARLQKIEDKRN
jgi:hypothetical protein